MTRSRSTCRSEASSSSSTLPSSTRRRARWQPPAPRFGRGWGWMFSEHILQANEGCDLDFLQTQFGATAGEPEIF